MIDPSLPLSDAADATTVDRRLASTERDVQFRRSVLVPLTRLGTPRPSGWHSIASGGVLDTVLTWEGVCTAPTLRWGVEFTDFWGAALGSIPWEIDVAAGTVPVVIATGTWTPADPLTFVAGNTNLHGVAGLGPRIHTEELVARLRLRGINGTGEPVGWRPLSVWALRAT